MPADFGSKELVWTLTVHGKTERAYATLNPNYAIDASVEQLDTAGINLWWAEEGVNKPPTVRVEGESRRRAKAGEPLLLTAIAADDGVPPSRGGVSRRRGWAARGVVHRRGAGRPRSNPRSLVSDPAAPPRRLAEAPPVPADHKFPVKVTFQEPGEYIVRVMAHDGGLATTADVRVTVE